MDTVWSIEIDKILGVGIFLGDQGIQNWALTRIQTLQAIDKLETLGVPVLGGDVCSKQGGRIFPNRDNWYCDRGPDESSEDFLLRSLQKSRNYIQDYQTVEVLDIFFNLVPDA